MVELSDISSQLKELGLNLDTVKKHRQALISLLDGAQLRHLPVIDTCRFGNKGILQLVDSVKKLSAVDHTQGVPFAAFVPAAGAASRYVKPLADLEQALETSDMSAAQSAIQNLVDQGAGAWPLPSLLKSLLSSPEKVHQLSAAESNQLRNETSLPKGLMPCVSEGYSFLDLKLCEHRHLNEVQLEVYIVPPGFRNSFKEAIEQSEFRRGAQANCEVIIKEQHGGLSTIRFNPDGSPYLDSKGDVSLVPAGHGTLTEFFPDLKGKARSLFIRNIDNIMGAGNEALTASSEFLTLHDKILTLMSGIRRGLEAQNWDAVLKDANILGSLAGLNPITSATKDGALEQLRSIQSSLFHTRVSEDTTCEQLTQLYQRPLNTLGQVPNTGKDIGGTPCFVTHQSEAIKICLEVPHASPDDKAKFLANPEKATHFNPVFAAAEVTSDATYYQSQNRDFWLIAEKLYRGSPVIYYETVLYELIGNSTFANTLFVEVPRLVFNPHKSMQDAASSSIKRWLPNS